VTTNLFTTKDAEDAEVKSCPGMFLASRLLR
jgi:hypothetical protein